MEYIGNDGDEVYLLCLKSQEYFAAVEDTIAKNAEFWSEDLIRVARHGGGLASRPVLPEPPLCGGTLAEEFKTACEEFARERLGEFFLETSRLLLDSSAACDDNIYMEWEKNLAAAWRIFTADSRNVVNSG
ncbi:MAG: hypothetical protein LBK41_01490 [Clostridiales bacterium]|jgi:hypothetical protein|nr:hypothetical protein [Clostridiales bacterium]